MPPVRMSARFVPSSSRSRTSNMVSSSSHTLSARSKGLGKVDMSFIPSCWAATVDAARREPTRRAANGAAWKRRGRDRMYGIS